MNFIVWLKKDLRLSDHAALSWAVDQALTRHGRVYVLWIDEPSMWRQADASARHFYFAQECLHELQADIAASGGCLLRLQGEATEILRHLQQKLGLLTLVSHEETGNAWSYERDLAVGAWCKTQGIEWREFPSNAVVRRLISHGGGRNRWTAHWQARMADSPLPIPENIPWGEVSFDIQSNPMRASNFGLQDTDAPMRQTGGRHQALALLHSFLRLRGQHYRSGMSSPLSGENACSRLSPYLAWGVLSIREIFHDLLARRNALLALPSQERPSGFLQSLKSFEGRLHWHCHFIQKLESEPAIEYRNMHKGFDDFRDENIREKLSKEEQIKLEKWETGQTGFPFIDACMRSLLATGWLNFRMRAVLMSFASYQLWLHWRPTGLHLARQFVDYEPGIHWSQCQMQSGVTGINAARIYNPVKQSQDQDPEGVFIRRWIPELAKLDSDLIHTPWLMPERCPAYPSPMIDLPSATRQAKEKIYKKKLDAEVKNEAQRVFQKHGSRYGSRSKQKEGISKRLTQNSIKQASALSKTKGLKSESAPAQLGLF